ncbi:MAG: hypothetical protein JNL11_14135 [Bdellovibrionaceae bacterium]|nr:hypothetical protein [Pseudobdellovibrionaceae bacterium]
MEKISSILPKSVRTQNIDHSKAQPARPGAPLLGRPMGRVTQKTVFEDQPSEALTRVTPDLSFTEKFSVDTPEDRVSLGDETAGEVKLAGYNRKGEIHKVRIADDISRNFANLEPKTEAASTSTSLSEDVLTRELDSMDSAPA